MAVDRSRSLRAFVGVALDEAVRSAVRSVADEIDARAKARGWRIRTIPAENLHLTLKFLGAVDSERMHEFLAGMRTAITSVRFEIALGGIGSFPPPPQKPTVLWLGVIQGREALTELAEQVDRCYSRFGLAGETRGFEPHLTVARVQHAAGDAAEVLDGVSLREMPRVSVGEVTLFRSELRAAGAAYHALGRVPLREG